MRLAACTLSSFQLRTGPGGGNLTAATGAGLTGAAGLVISGAGAASGGGGSTVWGVEHPASTTSHAVAPSVQAVTGLTPRTCFDLFISMECTIDFLCQFFGDAVHRREVFNARVAYPSCAAKAL